MNDLYISNREKIILEHLLNQKNGVTIKYLANRLNVSTRTIYREISSLESTLAQYQLRLQKEEDGYYIKGNSKFIEELQSEIYNASDELTTKKRQSLLMINLLMEPHEIKMESLAYDLKVSVGTIQQDLQAIEEIFKEYDIQIKRKKARGIKAKASESSLRLIVSGLIASELNEYNFFKLFDQNNLLQKKVMNKNKNPFLKVLDPAALEIVYKLVKQYEEFQFEEVNDTQLQSLILFITFSIKRIKENQLVALKEINKHTEELKVRERSESISRALLKEISAQYGLSHIPLEEVVFLALQIDGLNVPLRDEFSDDYDLQLSFQVRELIRSVSEEMQVQFYQDETLFKDLFAHISAAIQRNKAPMPEVNNPLLEKVHNEYKDLSLTIEEKLSKEFPNFEFQFNELLYVVIHFASAYERNSSAQLLNVLIICSSGMGTAKILESRLRKNIPEVTNVDVSRISQLHQLNYEKYDLILSTIFLQGFEEEYKVVTPLLMDDELKSIRTYVGQLLRKKVRELRDSEKGMPKKQEDHQSFQDLYAKIVSVKRLLELFDLKEIAYYKNLQETLYQICLGLPETVLEDPRVVAQKLEKRMNTAPIGIPNTGIGLFHCIHETIKEPSFSIVDLPQPFDIINMEQKKMKLNRILLLLAPDPMDASTQDMMGTISASIVESDANLHLFNNGSKEQIEHHLNQLFLEKMN
ncbi:BglG family transcription antiterminator [Marinilactibacillus psychrotolerans]|uniref:Mannitol operon transcriptional regulator n=1 Tax=Marinilactibacillus psychrotolerans TaxID=191770 RepID=A0AAV3WV41_9LACT|nr:BglG family transcription antiterminator [Marinilactibacillus psychrotolerans]GEL66000.1 transcription antiterminator BglG [Marinilactibacillus psychrotolerans]GEQ34724.1 mannitol operon transcriptional regulator [Marinilactibacillus psychrotolerans]